jgi:hypothetical protein
MHKQRTSAQTERSTSYAPRSSVAVTFLLLVAFFRAILVLLVAVTALRVLVLVLLVAILATLLATVALARRRPAAFAGLLVDVDVALLAVIPAGDPWVWDLRLATAAVVLLGLATAVGRLLLLLLVFVSTAERVEELFYEAGHRCCVVSVSEFCESYVSCGDKKTQCQWSDHGDFW